MRKVAVTSSKHRAKKPGNRESRCFPGWERSYRVTAQGFSTTSSTASPMPWPKGSTTKLRPSRDKPMDYATGSILCSGSTLSIPRGAPCPDEPVFLGAGGHFPRRGADHPLAGAAPGRLHRPRVSEPAHGHVHVHEHRGKFRPGQPPGSAPEAPVGSDPEGPKGIMRAIEPPRTGARAPFERQGSSQAAGANPSSSWPPSSAPGSS